jgi:Tol biopolymer transport system component
MKAGLVLSCVGAVVALVLASTPGGHAASSVVWFTGNDAPSWSPDGSLIAFTAFRGGNHGEIYVMRPDGTGQRNLTKDPSYDDLAAWSPDGKRIVFTSNRDGNNEIYVMDADGTDQTRLTHSGASDYSSSWSPDGRQIAFWSDRDGNNEIYVMNADGSDQTRLTTGRASDYSPSWGPDGRIAFVRTTGREQPAKTDLVRRELERVETRLVTRRHQDRVRLGTRLPGRQHRDLRDECGRDRREPHHAIATA